MLKMIFGDKMVAVFTAIALFGFSASIFAVVFAVRDCQAQETFEDKCASACYPNTVYSTQHRRCTCNASVTIREVK